MNVSEIRKNKKSGEFSEEQQEAIEWFEGPLLVLGTPGSGKTTVILHRVNHLITVHGVLPRQILVITFTKAAAASMEERYRRLSRQSGGVRFSTFHAFFYWIVRTAYKLPQDCVLREEERIGMIRTLLLKLSPEYGNNEEALNSILQQMDRITNDMVDIENYYSKDMPAEEFRKLYRMFTEQKKQRNKIDFNDMQQMCYELLASRKDILDRIRELYPYILVDEYQDTNRIQYEILKLVAHPADNLFAVGDDDQSIYGFRGARPEIMLGFSKEFPGARVVTLSTNYRCPDIVTDTSGRLIACNRHRYDKSLRAKRQAGAGDWVRVVKTGDDREENQRILNRITEAHKAGVPYTEMAVLFRTNENPRKLSFLLRSRGIPYTMRDSLPNLFRHMSVSPVMDYLYFAMGDRSRTRFLRFMNKPVRYIRRDMLRNEQVDITAMIRSCTGDKAYLAKNLRQLAEDLRRIRSLPSAAAINYIRKAVGYEKAILEVAKERNIDTDEITERLDELQSMAETYPGIEDFLRFAEAYEELLKEENRRRLDRDTSAERGVQLMTLHSAKGLEFQEVHILDCVEGVIPHRKSLSPQEMEEERRMLYVGMTRAVHKLMLYVPAMVGQKAVRPSPFIREMGLEKEK